jgi:methyl coenzyme M reductase subunit C-like uncharacterized protein (methanogenesis marker protein 7)
MKIKLLKKTRKRFQILHLPDGIVEYGVHYNYNLYKLTDTKGWSIADYVQLGKNKLEEHQFTNHIFKTHKECVDYLKQKIINRVKMENYDMGRKNKQITKKIIKVW